MSGGWIFNPPPGWQVPPGFNPPEGWHPEPSWPPAPHGWEFWLPASDHDAVGQAPAMASSPDDASDGSPRERELAARVEELERELASLSEVADLDDQRVLQAVGIYEYHHPLEDAVAYQERLKDLRTDLKAMIKAGDAVLASEMFTFNNSLARGRKLTADLGKLMLRAYNAEADIALRTLRAGNLQTATRRLESCLKTVEKLGKLMELRISPEFHAIRIAELELSSDYLMKVQEEKLAAREERARLREEAKAAKELEAERERLDKEHQHLENALQALREAGEDLDAIAELELRLRQVDEAIAQNDYRAANIRAGYVYVISNPGSFGEGIIKIGLTRRLEPMDRVHELGGASVPFRFSVHAVYFSEDAVTLENELHKHFSDRRLNHVNTRREFFFATAGEVREVLAAKAGGLLEFTERPEAAEYFQSRHYWPKD